MLTLADASVYFDRTPVLSVTNGATLFYGQVDPYQDSVRDSATAYRRILSVKPGTSMPANRLVKIHGSVWIIGDSETDGMAVAHRDKYVLHPAATQLLMYRLANYLTPAVSFTSWGDMVWFKDGKEDASSSRAVPMYSAYLPMGTDLQEYDVIKVGARGYLVQPSHELASGVLSATCVRLDYDPAPATLGIRVYDPVQGKYTSSTASTVTCLRVRWQSLYLYGSQGEVKYQEGDCSLVFPAGTNLATKDTVTLAGQGWSILAVESLGGAVVAHARKA